TAKLFAWSTAETLNSPIDPLLPSRNCVRLPGQGVTAMLHGKSDTEIIRDTHNTARFFTEHRHISWVLLVAALLWGVYGYLGMPKRKDPEFGRLHAMVVCPWPGASVEKVEQLVTRKIEEKIAQNSKIEKIESTSRTGVAVVNITMNDKLFETDKEFD